MNKSVLLIIATAFVCSSGFFKKGEDGSYSVDTAAAEKQANDAMKTASAEVDKVAKQAEAAANDAMEKIKAKAAKMNVPKEEIISDLDKSIDEIKTKVSAMDPAKLTAYLNGYNKVFSDTKTKVADYTQQVKDLKWTQKFSAKGKELKSQLTKYNDQFSGLKDQATLYMEKLKGYGLDPAALGIDLSAYGL